MQARRGRHFNKCGFPVTRNPVYSRGSLSERIFYRYFNKLSVLTFCKDSRCTFTAVGKGRLDDRGRRAGHQDTFFHRFAYFGGLQRSPELVGSY